MQASIRKIGNSVGVILHKNLLDKVGISTATPVDISIKKDTIVIKAVSKRRPINKDLSTWSKQIKRATRNGQSQGIGYWPEHISSELDKKL